MSNTIQFNMATVYGTKGRAAAGRVLKKTLGDHEYTFVIHKTKYKDDTLSHFDTGTKVGELNTIKHLIGSKSPIKAAKFLLDDLVETHGSDKLQAAIAKYPVINPGYAQ